MRTTTTAMAVAAATALAIPATASADVQSNIQVPLAGHLTVSAQMREHHRELAQQRLTRKATRLARDVAHARDRGFSARAYRRRVGDESPARLAARVRDAAARAEGRAAPPPPPPRWRRSRPASPAATRARTPATASTESTSSPWAPGRASAARAIRLPPPRPSRTSAPRSCTPARARRPGRYAAARLARLMDAAAFRDEFPVLERVAYLNAGTDGPLPRAAIELARAELDAEMLDGRLWPHFERRHALPGRPARRLRARCSAARRTTSR